MLFVNKREEREKLLVLEGGSAVLSAVASTERADVTWLGPRQVVVAGERCELRRDGRVHSLVLHNVAKEDVGIYTCLSPHDQMQFDVSVRGGRRGSGGSARRPPLWRQWVLTQGVWPCRAAGEVSAWAVGRACTTGRAGSAVVRALQGTGRRGVAEGWAGTGAWPPPADDGGGARALAGAEPRGA